LQEILQDPQCCKKRKSHAPSPFPSPQTEERAEVKKHEKRENSSTFSSKPEDKEGKKGYALNKKGPLIFRSMGLALLCLALSEISYRQYYCFGPIAEGLWFILSAKLP